MKRRRRKLGTQHGPTGSQAVGVDPKGLLTGSQAFGGADADLPLRGALLFGNDPMGNPRGSESFGGANAKLPLRGALLFGNDPMGNPRGSESFGGADATVPLKGALLFGNDPMGNPRGSESVGGADSEYQMRGAMSFGAGLDLPERLYKDDISYDFGGALLRADESGLAGIRKDSRDRVRLRVLAVLERRLGMKAERLRHGLSEDSIPWARLKREPDLDRGLAEALRDWYRRAPGERLGIGHVQALLEEMERMHTFEVRCEWDQSPMRLSVAWDDDIVAYAETTFHLEQEYFVFRSPEQQIFAYVDAIAPRHREQVSRICSAAGELVGTFELHAPGVREQLEEAKRPQLGATMRDARGQALFRVEEERASAQGFRARLVAPSTGEEVGRLVDQLTGGKIRTHIEVDVPMPRVLAWATAAVMADLARWRRKGWPEAPLEAQPPEVETIEDALGPRRPPRR